MTHMDKKKLWHGNTFEELIFVTSAMYAKLKCKYMYTLLLVIMLIIINVHVHT